MIRRPRLLVLCASLVLGCVVVHAQASQPASGGQVPAAGGQRAPGAPPAGRGRQAGPAPRIVTFESRPATIKPGETALLVWLIENPTAATIAPVVGRVAPRGQIRVTPSATTTYTLTVGTVTRSATVTIPGTTPADVTAPTAAPPAGAASAGAPIPRTPQGKPDFSGVYGWGGFGGGGGRGGGGAARGPAPAGPTLKPGAEKYRVNRAANPLDTGATSDCMPLIPPNSFGVPYEFQIIQNKDYVVILHEYPGTFRIVPLDAEHMVDPDPSWLGDSVAKWDGDTLVIDTIGYNEKTEISGYHHTGDLHTVERLTRVAGGMDYEITIEDPNVWVAPWKQTRSMRLTDAPQKRIFEFVCENNRDYKPLFGDRK